MKDCCNLEPSDKECVRKSDNKVFTLPRKYSKKKCKKGVKGFTMRSSCAPYKDCFMKKKTKRRKGGSRTNVAYFAGGCFWGQEDKFMRVNGVVQTRVGYMGGDKRTATYQQVCSGNTNHVETTEVTYDPTRIDYKALVKQFFTFHDPESFDKQGLDKGKQYRAIVFYKTKSQQKDAQQVMNDLKKRGFGVQTQLHKSNNFYEAEDEHQKYNQKNKKKRKINGGGSKKKTKKKEFLYNPDDPKKSFDVYIDKDPSDTIPIKYTTVDDVKKTIRKLERLYKNGKYPHKRIWQVGMIMRVRLKVLKDKKPREYKLAERYFQHLGKRTKIKEEKDRKRFHFKI